MANPLRLVMIRHGQSEANIVQHAQKLGQKIDLEKKVETRADWRQRLSPKGKEQAEKARRELSKIYEVWIFLIRNILHLLFEQEKLLQF